MDPIKPINLPFLQDAPCGSGALNEVSCALNQETSLPSDGFKLNFPTLAGCQNAPLVLSLTPKAIDKVEEAVARFRKGLKSTNSFVRATAIVKFQENLLTEFNREGFCKDKFLYAKADLLAAKTEAEARMKRGVGVDRDLYGEAVGILNDLLKRRKV